jgi:PAS domain S-box-containing protein
MVALGLIYYVAARLSLRIALIQENVTPLWPPTGIAVVAFLRYGRRCWPGVAIAAFLVNLPISTPLAAAVTAAGNVLAPVAASWLLERVDFHHSLDRVRDVVALVFLAALLSMTISATIGTTALVLSHAISAGGFWPAWSVWWTGDAMGVLVVAPFLLCLTVWRQLRPPLGWRDAGEAVVLTALLTAAAGVAVVNGTQLLFLVPPLVGWIAWRFQLRGAAPAVLLVSCIAVWAAVDNIGGFAGLTLARQMFTLQLFDGTVAFTAFFVSALVSERMAAREQLERSAADLEREVEMRTAELSGANVRLVQEVAERRDREADLRLSERALAEAQELAQLGRWSWDLMTRAVTWSDDMFEIHGVEPGSLEVTFETAVDLVIEDDRERIERNVRTALEERRPTVPDIEYRILRPDGELRALLGRGRLFFGDDGAPVRMVGVVQDITERREYDRQHQIAETLQRALLPRELPIVDGVALAAGYVPAEAGFKAGGDWYDVIPLLDGRVALVIGDVAGHGLEAASVMGQLRMAVRAYALEGHTPEEIIVRADALLRAAAPDELATMLYVEIDADLGTMRAVTAGHPPPIVLAGDDARYIELPPYPPLGVAGPRPPRPVEAAIEPGTTVVLYTDGLVERRDLSLDDGLDRLRVAMLARGDRPLEDLCRELMTTLVPGEAADDVAILGLRMEPVDDVFVLVVPAEPGELFRVRRGLTRWLYAKGVAQSDTDELVLACSEACANAIRHAYGPGGGTVEIEATRDDGAVEIVVRDAGRWRQRRGAGSGLGLTLIEAVASTVTFDQGGSGTTVTMRREVGEAVST